MHIVMVLAMLSSFLLIFRSVIANHHSGVGSGRGGGCGVSRGCGPSNILFSLGGPEYPPPPLKNPLGNL